MIPLPNDWVLKSLCQCIYSLAPFPPFFSFSSLPQSYSFFPSQTNPCKHRGELQSRQSHWPTLKLIPPDKWYYYVNDTKEGREHLKRCQGLWGSENTEHAKVQQTNSRLHSSNSTVTMISSLVSSNTSVATGTIASIT